MFRRGLFFRLIGLLVILVLLGAGGALIFRSGYSQGFMAGGLAAGTEGGAELFRGMPYGMSPYRWYGLGIGFSPLGSFLGLLFFGGLIVLLFGLFSRLYRQAPGDTGRWRAKGWPNWSPEAWEEHMQAWHKAHQSDIEAATADPGIEPSEDPKQ